MRKRVLIILFTLLLAGCVYKVDIQQGNIITPMQLGQLYQGMTTEQVLQLLGAPILVDPFRSDDLVYVYTFQPGHGKFSEKQLLLTFSGDRLIQKQFFVFNNPG